MRGTGNMKNTKALSQTAVVAALYVALTTLNPLSWGAVQFRVANMLPALIFGGIWASLMG